MISIFLENIFKRHENCLEYDVWWRVVNTAVFLFEFEVITCYDIGSSRRLCSLFGDTLHAGDVLSVMLIR